MKDILKMDIMTLHKHIANKEISCMEITAAYLQNIEKKDEKIKAYITVTKEEAEKRAKSLDERLSLNSNIPLLYGIPGALKDNICTKGILTTCASKMLYDFIAPNDATVYEKLNDNGMTLLGKLNMDEFAMGSTTTTSYFHKTYNPYDLSKSCGGSSGGSAAAVASEQTLFALGSDTGGSIRQPASFCNVVGMKPTYGTVSRYGLIAFASSLDQIGPMTRTVYDNALVLDAISGYDKKDSTSVMKPSGSYTDDIGKDIKNMKMGVIRQFAAKKINSQVVNTVNEAINWYEKQGVEIVELDMPSLDWAIYAYYIISSAEASSNLARFDGIRYGYRPDEFEDIDRLYDYSRSNGFDTEVKRRIMLGTFVLSQGYYDQYYNKAQKVRRLVETEFDRAFKECDFILAPVAASTAYDIKDAKKDAVAMYMEDIFTVPVNIAKLPAIALPGAISEENLPIGIQLIGPKLSEKTLYRAGYAYEKRNREVSHV